MTGKTVAVLMGGWSAEREVSLSSGEACAKALVELRPQCSLSPCAGDTRGASARSTSSRSRWGSFTSKPSSPTVCQPSGGAAARVCTERALRAQGW